MTFDGVISSLHEQVVSFFCINGLQHGFDVSRVNAGWRKFQIFLERFNRPWRQHVLILFVEAPEAVQRGSFIKYASALVGSTQWICRSSKSRSACSLGCRRSRTS